MNSFFEKVFADASKQYLEAVLSSTLIEEELFSSLPKLHKIYRMPYFSGRRYFTLHKGQPLLMTGLTGITKKIISRRSQDSFLHKWGLNMVKDGGDPEEYTWLASEFGTLVHIVAAHIFSARAKKESFNTIGLDKELVNYMLTIGVSGSHFKNWYNNLCSAIRSLNSFYSKSEMDVRAVEYCVIDFDYNICTPLDIICEMNTEESVEVPMKTKSGTKKEKRIARKVWNLNIKARQNPVRRSTDQYQLCAEKYMANKYFNSHLIEKTGVLSPSFTWKIKENADCKLHDFTDSFSERDWDTYINQFIKEPGNVNKDLFDPDLTQTVEDVNVFSVNGEGDIFEAPERTVSEYIMSFYDK